MSVINTNVSSLIAQNAITSNSLSQSKAMQQLSTGLRINGAKDDAAGLAIASKMTSQIKGLDQAVRNANDAISMLQTADGALVAVSDMMQRMRELAVQGASDTNVASDRTALNAEFSQLKGEIGRIAKSTQWNGMNILDGSANSNTGSFNFQVGASAGQSVNKTIPSMGLASSAAVGTVATTTPADATHPQTSTLTLSGTFAAGDVITVTGSKSQFQYTVTTANVGGADNTANLALISTAMASAMAQADGTQPSFMAANGIASSTAAAAVTTFVGTTNNVSYIATGTTSATISNGGSLANINDLSITSAVTATKAISSMDTAIATVNSQRSDLGATINRLTYAADNLANVSQNAQASRSRVQDTDYAKTSTELARTQIIAQAATAMLAQANQSQQSVLALLK
jgi:flagellin